MAFSFNGKGYYGLNPQTLSLTQSNNAKGGELWEYEPSTDAWSKKTEMPLDWVRGGGAATLIGNKLYYAYSNSIGGGVDGETKYRSIMMYVYDFDTNVWSEKARLPMRMAATGNQKGAVTLNGKVYLHTRIRDGAVGIPDSPLPRLFCYDPANNDWTELKASPATKMIYSAIAYNNKIYVVYQNPPYGAANSLEWWEYTP